MKKILAAIVLFAGVSVNLFAQQAVTIDEAIQQTGAYLIDKLPHNTIIAILNIASDTPETSAYIMDKLTELLVKSSLTFVDRHNLDLIRKEEQYQMSGEVSDDSAVGIGKKLGAQIIISGSFKKTGVQYRMTIRAIAVETAQVLGITTYTVKMEKTLADLFEKDPDAKSTWDSIHDKNRLYLGAKGGLSLGFYENGGGLADTSVYYAQSITGIPAFDGALYVSVPIWNLLAVQAEAYITNDTFELFSGNTSLMMVSYNSLMIPLLAKLVWRPSIFTLQGYGGAYLSLPLGTMKITHNNGSYDADFPLMTGFMAGGGFGVKLGPGFVMADIRYASDFGTVTAGYNGIKDVSRRSNACFALGYEIGLLPKNKGNGR